MTPRQLSAALAWAGMTALSASALLAQHTPPRIHDSTSADSIRFDQPPLPGGAVAISRFLFSEVPQWIQIGGVILGVIVAGVVIAILWKRWRNILQWILTRSRAAKIALGTSVVAAIGLVGAGGAWSWNFMMHENDFCSSCHVMKTAFNRFQKSEHDKLQCHDCHRQSIFASSKELYYWVLDRPEKIPKHAPVPNRICQECHEQPSADSTWKRVIATAGHQVHFKSDSASLKGLSCTDCHAREVHAFKAVDHACQESGCHDKVTVRLGAMANQSGLHCITCHDFGRSVAEHISVDSTKQALVPARQECFSCHVMQEKLAKHSLDKDPHKGNCGTCHNPHDQTNAPKAFETCANAGCHSNPDTLTAFHRGLGEHRLTQCGMCHKPHSWKVESTTCTSCHRDIYQDKPRRSELLRSVVGPARRAGPSDEPNNADDWAPSAGGWRSPQQGSDSAFLHSRHKGVACLTCHSTAQSHGALRVTSKADCQACHHVADARAGACSACHTASEIATPRVKTTRINITGRASPRERSLSFAHGQHSRVVCESCHGTDVAKPVSRDCASCHSDHHRPNAQCASCHSDAKGVHARSAHVQCGTCHNNASVAALPPSRGVCLACHQAQVDHKPNGDCATCHLTRWDVRSGSS